MTLDECSSHVASWEAGCLSRLFAHLVCANLVSRQLVAVQYTTEDSIQQAVGEKNRVLV